MKQKISCLWFLLVLALIPQRASAYTECTVNISRIWIGDDGYLWLLYTNGGSGYLLPNDPDREGTLSAGTTALVAQRQMIVRYQADGVACTSTGRSDLVGVYLL